jgi:hypothetical protein
MEASIDYPVGRYLVIDNGGGYDESERRPERVVCRPGGNLGVAASWNLAIKANPFAPWWMFVNADIVFGPATSRAWRTTWTRRPARPSPACSTRRCTTPRSRLTRRRSASSGYGTRTTTPATARTPTGRPARSGSAAWRSTASKATTHGRERVRHDPRTRDRQRPHVPRQRRVPPAEVGRRAVGRGVRLPVRRRRDPRRERAAVARAPPAAGVVILCGWCGKATANEDRCTSCGHLDPVKPWTQRGQEAPVVDACKAGRPAVDAADPRAGWRVRDTGRGHRRAPGRRPPDRPPLALAKVSR